MTPRQIARERNRCLSRFETGEGGAVQCNRAHGHTGCHKSAAPWGSVEWADKKEKRAPGMRVHCRVSRENRHGGTFTGSLCGRLNKACSDGMNITDEPDEVTCAFCRKDPRFKAKVSPPSGNEEGKKTT